MLLNKDSFKLNSLSMGKYVESIEFGYNKAWGSDSGRNMKFSMSGTFLGVIPKFRLNFIKLSQEELETLAPILNSAWQEATYYDPKLKRNTTIDTYTGFTVDTPDTVIVSAYPITFSGSIMKMEGIENLSGNFLAKIEVLVAPDKSASNTTIFSFFSMKPRLASSLICCSLTLGWN